jgi:hypothetical protein
MVAGSLGERMMAWLGRPVYSPVGQRHKASIQIYSNNTQIFLLDEPGDHRSAPEWLPHL